MSTLSSLSHDLRGFYTFQVVQKISAINSSVSMYTTIRISRDLKSLVNLEIQCRTLQQKQRQIPLCWRILHRFLGKLYFVPGLFFMFFRNTLLLAFWIAVGESLFSKEMMIFVRLLEGLGNPQPIYSGAIPYFTNHFRHKFPGWKVRRPKSKAIMCFCDTPIV